MIKLYKFGKEFIKYSFFKYLFSAINYKKQLIVRNTCGIQSTKVNSKKNKNKKNSEKMKRNE